jgi:hypothetical protein
MSLFVALIALGFLSVVVGLAVLVLRTRSYAAQLLLAAVLVLPTLFCLYGFAATFEPLDAGTQWTFRIGYSVIGLSLAAIILMLLMMKKSDADI